MERKHVKWNDTTKVRGLEILGQFEQFIREGGAPSPELLAGVDELKDIIDAKARAEGIHRSKTRVDSSRQPGRKSAADSTSENGHYPTLTMAKVAARPSRSLNV